jgi:HAD superfamily hydrolase (TIGR01549 family)
MTKPIPEPNFDRITAVTVDFWNTLFDNTAGLTRLKLRTDFLTARIGQNYDYHDEPKILAAYSAASDRFNKIWLEEAVTANAADAVRYIFESLALHPSETDVSDIAFEFEENILQAPPNLAPNAKDAVLALHERGIRLGIISDTYLSPGRVLRKLIEAEGLSHCFSSFVFSDETGFAKPNPKAFHLSLDRLNAKPHDALHIGDLEQTDVVGAKQSGMTAVLYAGLNTEWRDKTTADITIHDWQDVVPLITQS